MAISPDNITLPSKRSRAKLRDILNAYATRIREIEGFNAGNVVISDQVIPRAMPLGRYCISVAFGEGRFPTGPWEASHHRRAAVETVVHIGIFVQNARDRPGRSETAIVDEGSIVDYFERVLGILTVAETGLGERSQPWEPSSGGIPMLKSTPIPESFTSAQDVPKHEGWVGMQLAFAVEFDWNLYGG